MKTYIIADSLATFAAAKLQCKWHAQQPEGHNHVLCVMNLHCVEDLEVCQKAGLTVLPDINDPESAFSDLDPAERSKAHVQDFVKIYGIEDSDSGRKIAKKIYAKNPWPPFHPNFPLRG